MIAHAIAAGLSLIALTGAASAQSHPLPAPVTSWRVIAGGGHDDVLLVHGRRIALLSGGGAPAISAPSRLPDWVAAIDVPSTSRTIVGVGSRGVGRWAIDGDHFLAPLAEWPADVEALPASPDRLLWTTLCAGDTVFLPHVRGALAFDPEGTATTVDLPLDRTVHVTGGDPMDRIVAELRAAPLVSGDLDGDDRSDLGVVRSRHVDGFGRDADGRWRRERIGRLERVWRAGSSRLLELAVPARCIDFDRDGHLDLIDIDANGGRVRITFGPLLGAKADRTTRLARLQGLIVGLEVLDAGGANPPRLLLMTTESISLTRGARVFLTQALPVSLLAIDVGEDRTLSPARPVGRIRIPVAVGGSLTSPKKARPRTGAVRIVDLDRDGTLDLLVIRGDSVRVHRGEASGFSRAPAWTLRDRTIRAIHGIVTADLDGDGRPEVVAHGSDRDEKPRLWILRHDR